MHRSRLAGRSSQHNGVIQGPVILQGLDNAGDGRILLADSRIDTNNIFSLLVNNRIQRNGGFAGLPVADNQFPLAAADRNHRIDCLNPALQRPFHRLAFNYAGGHSLYGTQFFSVDSAFSVQGLAQRIDHPADEGLTHRHLQNLAGKPHRVGLFNSFRRAEDSDAGDLFFQIQNQPKNLMREFH